MHKVKNPKQHHMFGKSTRRYFVLDMEAKTFGYKTKANQPKLKKVFTLEVSLIRIIVRIVFPCKGRWFVRLGCQICLA